MEKVAKAPLPLSTGAWEGIVKAALEFTEMENFLPGDRYCTSPGRGLSIAAPATLRSLTAALMGNNLALKSFKAAVPPGADEARLFWRAVIECGINAADPIKLVSPHELKVPAIVSEADARLAAVVAQQAVTTAALEAMAAQLAASTLALEAMTKERDWERSGADGGQKSGPSVEPPAKRRQPILIDGNESQVEERIHAATLGIISEKEKMALALGEYVDWRTVALRVDRDGDGSDEHSLVLSPEGEFVLKKKEATGSPRLGAMIEAMLAFEALAWSAPWAGFLLEHWKDMKQELYYGKAPANLEICLALDRKARRRAAAHLTLPKFKSGAQNPFTLSRVESEAIAMRWRPPGVGHSRAPATTSPGAPSHAARSSAKSPRRGAQPRGTCWKFNRTHLCPKGAACQFEHRCAACGQEGPPPCGAGASA